MGSPLNSNVTEGRSVRGTDYAHLITTGTPAFSDLAFIITFMEFDDLVRNLVKSRNHWQFIYFIR